jgi:hypothetical protein
VGDPKPANCASSQIADRVVGVVGTNAATDPWSDAQTAPVMAPGHGMDIGGSKKIVASILPAGSAVAPIVTLYE